MVYSMLIGYLIGSISPSALIAKLKKTNLRETGTGNMGATNVTLSCGKALGCLVMLFDMFKAFLAFKLCASLFSKEPLAGMMGGCFAVFGHIFPFYMDFKGGKGFATFGGLVLAYDWRIFIIILIIALVLMFAVNYSFVMPFTGGIAFPFAVGLTMQNPEGIALSLMIGVTIIVKHWGNMLKAINKKDIPVRDFIKNVLFKKECKQALCNEEE